MASTLVAELAPEHLRGRYQGFYGLVWGVALVAAPTLGTTVLQRFGSRTLWPSCLAACVVVAVAHLAIGAGRRRRFAVRAAAEPVV